MNTRAAHATGIDTSRPLTLTVDGQALEGFSGDTIASALVAAGRLTTAPSMYRQRPRGIVAAGPEEPNGLVTVKAHRTNSINETMLPVTAVEAIDGLEATYVQGQGSLDPTPDTNLYDHVYKHADVLVIGAGPAGLAAARAALRGHTRVYLMDDQSLPGGSLLSDPHTRIDNMPGHEWARHTINEMARNPNFTYLSRTTAFGSYDSNFVIGVEKRTDHLDTDPGPGVSRERLWHVRAAEVVLATGALERPLVFAHNDRPGIMLASAVRTYLNRYGALAGRSIALFTTNDSPYAMVPELQDAGATVVAIVDARHTIPESAALIAQRAGVEVMTASAVLTSHAASADDPRLGSITVCAITAEGSRTSQTRTLDVDVVAVSGGWSPNIHLHTQRQGATRWVEEIAGYVPSSPVPHQAVAGSVTGRYSTADALEQGHESGQRAAQQAASAHGFETGDGPQAAPSLTHTYETPLDNAPVRALWLVEGETPDHFDDHLVDFQRDQSVADIYRAYGAGMTNIEHIKRYTSIGTAHDQGKTSGVNTTALLAEVLGHSDLGKVGLSRHRAPYVPVSFAALAGRRRGELFDPARVSAIHPWHVAHGARFEDVGQWKRPWYYPHEGESMDEAVLRECRAARESVAFMDGSTLGKIEIRGKDAAEFVNRVYTNGFALLKVGKIRYGVMCTHDGMIFDDGVSMRLAEDRYLMTTTSSGAAKVLDWLEDWAQTEWPELDVTLTSVTEQYATITVVGPRSRDVIAAVAPDLDVSNEAFGFMEFRDTHVLSAIPARICRISFSGELAYEINVETFYGLSVWEAVAQAGEQYNITPYGTETMHVLRAEKGFIIVGQDTDGTVTPHDAGMSWVVSTKKKDFIGKRSFERPDTKREDRKHLVSVIPKDRRTRLMEGSQLIEPGVSPEPRRASPEDPLAPGHGQVPSVGWVTSSYLSHALGHPFALALIENGRNRIGESLLSPQGDSLIEVEVGELVLFDPKGTRRDG